MREMLIEHGHNLSAQLILSILAAYPIGLMLLYRMFKRISCRQSIPVIMSHFLLFLIQWTVAIFPQLTVAIIASVIFWSHDIPINQGDSGVGIILQQYVDHPLLSLTVLLVSWRWLGAQSKWGRWVFNLDPHWHQ